MFFNWLCTSYVPFNSQIRQFVNSKTDLSKDAIWLGYTDIETEREWKLLNGETYNAGDRNHESLYYWHASQPNNYGGNEDCAHIWLVNNLVGLNDNVCSKNAFSSWKFYGLCEICQA